jgi:hypothetical protein
MNLSILAAASATDLLIAEVQGLVKVTRLPRRGPRKGEALANRIGGAATRWQPAARAQRAGRHNRSGNLPR